MVNLILYLGRQVMPGAWTL